MTQTQANEPGFVLVPREPTDEMLRAMANAGFRYRPVYSPLVFDIYAAALAAAPLVPSPAYGGVITIWSLQAAHVVRQEEWCPDQKPDLSFRGNEMAGEVGEACNVIKKLERERQGWRGSRATIDDLGDELADIIHTAILCAITAGIDLEPRVVAKFNATSDKNGLTTRLPGTLAYDDSGSGVKALEWREDTANTPIGRYAIRRTPDGYEVSVEGEEIAHLGYDAPRAKPSARDAARDYAQADFERRVLSCLSDTAAGAGPVEPRRMAEGCCSAVNPCGHQQRDPYSICDVCTRAAGAGSAGEAAADEGWQPIETAPTGGKFGCFLMLAFGPQGDQTVSEGMHFQGRFYAASVFYTGGPHDTKQFTFREHEVKPTHWRHTLVAPGAARPVEEPGEVERLTRGLQDLKDEYVLVRQERDDARECHSYALKLAKTAEAEIDRWRENSRANWEAFSAMRNDINELVGNMASSEAALINGPEMQHQCEAVAASVRDKLERQERLLREASSDAGKWEDRCRAAEAALAETRERLEKVECERDEARSLARAGFHEKHAALFHRAETMEGLVFLADQALMELHGRFPLDAVTNEQRRLRQACKALRAITGPNHETRNIRADQVRAALTGDAQEAGK